MTVIDGADVDRPERETDGWQLERSGPAAYERYLVPPLFAPWAERLVDEAGIRGADRVLDVGCGTGIVARRAAERAGDEGTVIGLDRNEGMLAVAATVGAGSRPEIEWRRGDATDLPFPDASFDAVLCQQALQFVSDPADALREMRRVLRPRGRVAASVWRPLRYSPGHAELAGALENRVGDDAGAMMRSPFPDWTGDDLRALARDAGFGGPSITIGIGSVRYPSVGEFVRREVASSPLSEPLADVEPQTRTALVREVGDALADHADDEGLVFPMEAYVLTARR